MQKGKSVNKKWSLIVSHSIFLSREERYKVAEGETIEAYGSSLPVWVSQSTGKTSEPATEVFCKYLLVNKDSEEEPKNIKYTKEIQGYKIFLPKCEEIEMPDEWENLSVIEKDIWNEVNPKTPSIKNLKDYKDNGGKSLYFEEANKIKRKVGVLNVVHSISIKSNEFLNESLL